MKIPKPRKRGSAYRIELMIDGVRLGATRDTAKECEDWAALKLLESRTQSKEEKDIAKPHYPVRLLFTKYLLEVGKYKKSHKYIKSQVYAFIDQYPAIADMSIYDITPEILTSWRKSRSGKVKPGTVLRQMSLYSSIFGYAVTELFLLEVNPFTLVSKPKKPKGRDRRISDAEADSIIAALGYERGTVPTTPGQYVAWSFLFAIETAMRRAEILGIHREHIFDDYIHLPDTKNGDIRNVPLLNSAIDMLKLIQHGDDKLIPHNDNSFKKKWEREKKTTDIKNLHFHDTRHEAITRFVRMRKVPVEILMKITGHKTASILINTYYNPTASEISKMLNSPS